MKVNMNLTSFLRDLFLVETECTLSFAIIGTLFARNASISYAHIFIPLAFGLICMIPCIPVYLKENMTIPQVLIQRSVELVILEIVIVSASKMLVGPVIGIKGLIAVAVSVVLFDFLSYFFMYKMEKAETEKLNKKLRELAEKKSQAENKESQSQKIEEPAGKNMENIEAFGEFDRKVQLKLGEILYFEADAEHVFAYTQDEIYQMKLRLYQVESISKPAGIIRASKSYLVNLNKIQSVRTALNSRLYAKMPNGEEVLFSRKYAPVLKEAMLS
ncbi:LytTR family transcriptional regulator [Treponema ruminis]|uniref:DNA-binding LytR/AlgR family response regulator n=1 Tax=Treponema ruminis TaxID=744515 RepID=A0A7W8LLI8_9SPIR|nr:LytTR family DNA-binding domain-containing protein [Treponema ruminis]MBB5225527.1 DNA-binding LytR/AlgR family response regulator [Treponema ruminis]QSI01604.1 LytTR family transcriptional regulator [Treponema ruminis]